MSLGQCVLLGVAVALQPAWYSDWMHSKQTEIEYSISIYTRGAKKKEVARAYSNPYVVAAEDEVRARDMAFERYCNDRPGCSNVMENYIFITRKKGQ